MFYVLHSSPYFNSISLQDSSYCHAFTSRAENSVDSDQLTSQKTELISVLQVKDRLILNFILLSISNPITLSALSQSYHWMTLRYIIMGESSKFLKYWTFIIQIF